MAGYTATGRSSRNQHALTTAPATGKRPTRHGTPTDIQSDMSNTFGAGAYSGLKPNFFNMDIPLADMQPSVTKAAIFQNKRHTVQPHSISRDQPSQHQSRGVTNVSETVKLSAYARQALKSHGCAKEQNKQYLSYVSEAAKNNNSALRRQIEGASHQQARKPVAEANKALIAIMPVPELSAVATNHGNVAAE